MTASEERNIPLVKTGFDYPGKEQYEATLAFLATLKLRTPIVVNEKTLAYLLKPENGMIGLLAGYNAGEGWTYLGIRDVVRLATRLDFDTYRVHSGGHL